MAEIIAHQPANVILRKGPQYLDSRILRGPIPSPPPNPVDHWSQQQLEEKGKDLGQE